MDLATHVPGAARPVLVERPGGGEARWELRAGTRLAKHDWVEVPREGANPPAGFG